MSYGIIRVQKFKASDVRGIQSHDLRERPPRTNPDIDPERTPNNYRLVESDGGWNKAIKARLETLESSKAVRKDAVVMVQALVTSDSDFFQGMPPEKQREFFRDSLEFIAQRYGKSNILAATVHMDEKTPHMHVNFTPIRDGRLSAKALLTREEFQCLQSDFHQAVGQAWGLARGESREEKRKHLDGETFKHQTRMAAMQKDTEAARAELDKAKGDLSRFGEVREGTAQAVANAHAWSAEQAKQAEQRRLAELAAEKTPASAAVKEQTPQQQGHGRSMSMGR